MTKDSEIIRGLSARQVPYTFSYKMECFFFSKNLDRNGANSSIFDFISTEKGGENGKVASTGTCSIKVGDFFMLQVPVVASPNVCPFT